MALGEGITLPNEKTEKEMEAHYQKLSIRDLEILIERPSMNEPSREWKLRIAKGILKAKKGSAERRIRWGTFIFAALAAVQSAVTAWPKILGF